MAAVADAFQRAYDEFDKLLISVAIALVSRSHRIYSRNHTVDR
jgi:hypothetical protein